MFFQRNYYHYSTGAIDIVFGGAQHKMPDSYDENYKKTQ